MTTRLRRCQQMIYTEHSIYADSYPPQPVEIRKYENIQPPPVIKKKELKYKHKNIEFLLSSKRHIPFDLMWRPKEIVRTNPHDVQPRYEKIIDEDRELSQRTRRRLAIPPQVKVDDIEDADLRSLVMKETYASTYSCVYAGQTEVTSEGVKAPRPDHPAPANPVFLPLWQPSSVPPEWRRETVSWDKLQRRTHVDTEKEFWNQFHTYKPSKCDACEQSKLVTKLKKMRLLA